jgi:hypothetical protein
VKVIADTMPRKSKKTDSKQKLKQIVDLLKFILTFDDEEIRKTTIESVIELLEEEINK